ncbi:hypothetical protein FB45DRAFT_892040 [Roridomyces roridus]|uniref:Uncharacterized protein n=1 Tax=Roridomyces roridus TaxID=1738132 RepID=A0AAD7CF14_9AGAR|nr:hypothetical protein FB45DRAFT_892040 [Roridomyces roridus]
MPGARTPGGDESLAVLIFVLLAQTFFFAVHTVLFPLSTRALLKSKKFPNKRALLFVIIFMYLLSAAFWGFSIAVVVDGVRSTITMTSPIRDGITSLSSLFTAIVLINYVLVDGVIILRAWKICQPKLRKFLWISVVLLVATAVVVLLMVGFRASAFMNGRRIGRHDFGDNNNVHSCTGVTILQVLALALSFATNLRSIRVAFRQEGSQWEQIFVHAIDSGVPYCFSSLTILLAPFITLPAGPLADIWIPINVQLASVYPTLLILLLNIKYCKPQIEPKFVRFQISSPLITKPKPSQLSRFSDDSFA